MEAGGSDVIDVRGFGLTFSSLQQYLIQAGNDTVLNFGGDVMTLRNVLASQLQASDFQF
jgi:hypothetical protein